MALATPAGTGLALYAPAIRQGPGLRTPVVDEQGGRPTERRTRPVIARVGEASVLITGIAAAGALPSPAAREEALDALENALAERLRGGTPSTEELRAAIAINPYNSAWYFDLGLTLDEIERITI